LKEPNKRRNNRSLLKTINHTQKGGIMTDHQAAQGPTMRDKARKFMLEPYLDWAEGEGVPIY
jgi:hypothetical protein